MLQTLDQTLTDLRDWTKKLGISESKVIPLYDAIVRENGLFAALIVNRALGLIPFARELPVRLGFFDETIGQIHSAEYAAWLLEQPEPTPKKLTEVIANCKDLLPNLKLRWLEATKCGPRLKRGGAGHCHRR
jgi:hypothetical protein